MGIMTHPPAERRPVRVPGAAAFAVKNGIVSVIMVPATGSAARRIPGAVNAARKTAARVKRVFWNLEGMGAASCGQARISDTRRHARHPLCRSRPVARNYFERPSGCPCLTDQKNTTIKKNAPSKSSISLGDLITTVSSYARNEREMVAALSDLFRRGGVVAKTRRGSKRLQLA